MEIAELIIQGLVAAGTIGAVVVALCQIRRDAKIRRNEEVQAQAKCIAAWFEDISLSQDTPGNQYNAYRTGLIRNNNLMPIYDVVVTVVGLYGAGPAIVGEDNSGDFAFRAVFPQIATGLWGFWIDTGGGGMHAACTLEIAFRDSAGKSWVRRGNGTLAEISKGPLEYYSISLPTSWSFLERINQ